MSWVVNIAISEVTPRDWSILDEATSKQFERAFR